mmetsp:Transcript_76289/g.241244  ORF Transcript_76289/g.241244 Transcript_76289/m.241244 type:complete len:225 (+) Transcript_76289:316-990(+)
MDLLVELLRPCTSGQDPGGRHGGARGVPGQRDRQRPPEREFRERSRNDRLGAGAAGQPPPGCQALAARLRVVQHPPRSRQRLPPRWLDAKPDPAQQNAFDSGHAHRRLHRGREGAEVCPEECAHQRGDAALLVHVVRPPNDVRLVHARSCEGPDCLQDWCLDRHVHIRGLPAVSATDAHEDAVPGRERPGRGSLLGGLRLRRKFGGRHDGRHDRGGGRRRGRGG